MQAHIKPTHTFDKHLLDTHGSVMDNLKLIALDPDGLEVISAHLQDGIVLTGDMAYLPKEQRFIFTIRRFDWEGEKSGQFRRRLAGVRFDRVCSVRSRGINRSMPEEVLNLLAIIYRPASSPSGTVVLIFSDDKVVELDIECIEIQLKDLGPVWEAESRPEH